MKYLIKRNIKLFLRDKATVFFSFLSTIIIIALYFLFIAKLYTTSLDANSVGGVAMNLNLSENAKNFIVYLQMMAGVLVLNSMSLSTGVFSTIAKDFEDKRIDSFLLTPIKKHEIILSYFISGLIVSFSINMLTWILSFLIIGLITGFWLAMSAFLLSIVVLLVSSFVSCSIMLLITSIVKSSAAIGVVNGVSGTLFGFLCGIYMPYSNLGSATKTVGSFLPFTHITIWMKQTVLNSAFSQVGIDEKLKVPLYRDFFSAENIGIGSLSVPLWLSVSLCAVFGLICVWLSWTALNKRMRNH